MSQTSTKDLKKILEPVQGDLDLLEERIINEISPASRALTSIIQEIFKAGGKRIRPALSFLFYKALNVDSPNIPENIFLITEISELIHTASLVHDDIIDNSFVRRGRPTANSKWDNAITVISGDFMFARAAVNLGKVGINEVTRIFAKVLEDLCDGEIKQAEKKFSIELDYNYYYSKTYKKTASLFEAACKAPVIALGASDDIVIAAADYGEKLGMAFQIIDDILDFTSDEKTLGKPAFADLRDGQITLPVLLALEKIDFSSAIQKLSMSESLEEKNLLTKEIYSYILDTNSIEASFAKARECINEALTALNPLPNSIYKTALQELAEFIVTRVH